MSSRKRIVPLGLLVMILISAQFACQSGGKGKGGSLDQALEFAPADTQTFAFTDWSLIKTYEGVEDLTSESPIDDRKEFWLTLNKSQTAFSCYACERFLLSLDEVWGWDTSDLNWEAELRLDGPPVYVLKLRSDFDLDPVRERFVEREFTQEKYEGIVIYSHLLDLQLDWIRTGGLSIVNTAILEKEQVLVLSSNVEQVQAVLDVYSGEEDSLADDKDIQSLTKQLGTVASLAIGSGEETCMRPAELFAAKVLNQAQIEKLREIYGLDKPLIQQVREFQWIAIGYRYEDDRSVGLIGMYYSSASSAENDLERRSQWAEEGLSLRMNAPFSEVYFTVEEAYVKESVLMLKVRPLNDMPRRLYQMYGSRDMVFALCPGE
jgi:hypothetical protein